MREIKTSVTVFIHYQGEYLFLHRTPEKIVDGNRINGIGGKVEPKEDYLQAAIRETKEETGYEVDKEQVNFLGLLKLEGGYPQDWLVAFFEIEVDSKNIPIGSECREGKFLWLKPEELFEQEYELVDDLNYIFQPYIQNNKIFFANARINEEEKVEEINVSELSQ